VDPIEAGVERADQSVGRFLKIIALPKKDPVQLLRGDIRLASLPGRCRS